MSQHDLFKELNFSELSKVDTVFASFSIERKIWIDALRNIKRPIHLSRKDMYLLKFELFVMEDKLLLQIFENQHWMDIKTKGTCRTSLFYKDVMDALISSKEFWIDVQVKQKTIGINQVNLSSATEQLDSDHREIPLNAIVDPIQAADTYAVTPRKNFFTLDLQKGFYTDTVMKDIRYVRAALKKYNIPKNDIETFIFSYLQYSQIGNFKDTL